MRNLVICYVLVFITSGVLAATSCTIGSGLKGECISTKTCSQQKGRSEAGHCPGPTDIQCCTWGGGCTIPGGVRGNCQPTDTCSGKKTPGLCPGPANIQCCTSASATSPSPRPPPSPTPPGNGGKNCSPPPVNQATINLIKSFEGFVTKPAPDPIGLPTVGYGHLCKTKGCGEVKYSFPLTQTTATQLLHDDLKSFESCVYNDIQSSVRLTDNQYGALVSWAFNVGCGNIKTSTLVKRLNAKENPNTVVSEELPKWDKAGGKSLPGLVRRRAAEVHLFKEGSSKIAHPAC